MTNDEDMPDVNPVLRSPVSATIKRGDTEQSLIALRDDLAQRYDVALNSQAAAIAGRLLDVIAKIDALHAGAKREGSDRDALAERRRARRQEAASS